MTADPWPTPTRREQRAEFPEHSAHTGPGVLSGPDAAERARVNLAAWLATHPAVPRGD